MADGSLILDEIRRDALAYLSHSIDVDTFWDRLVKASCDIDESDEYRSQPLSRTLERLFAEFSSQAWTEAEFRERLQALLFEPKTLSSNTTMAQVA